ncbi:hypothetical protein CN582_03150 [Bacillus wiedmannii]|nr:hypothetical protein CN690_23745 [Bacillus wiedmannii]PEP22229.1 hypothetical protein CN580_18650 [Bacillus wiedmannii]PEP99288.1 hypothetical protein CN582_03150 [Bacillus wiedmannii]PFY73386.1 hypothetical protein COL61_13545 [Bacillus wiedmannii]PHF07384.1 hypothetical protein COF74_15505 [Bacillus wiedmannii]
MYLEIKVYPNVGEEISLRCNYEFSSDFNVIPFTACISISVKDDLNLLINLSSLIIN